MFSKRRWWAVVTAALSIFLISTDLTIVSLALPDIARQFGLTNQLASAVPLAYSISLTLFLVPLGGLINRFRPLALFSLLDTVMLGGALYYLLPFDFTDIQHLAPESAGLVLLCLPLGTWCAYCN